MASILSRRAFPGPALDVVAAGGSFVGQATFRGAVVCCLRPRAEVAALLPPELTLAANVSADPELHPIVFVLGEQTEGATIVGGRSVPLGIRYGEFALAVPFVHWGGGTHLNTWIPAMVSGYGPATWSGNALYGFSKRMGDVRRDGPFLLVTSEQGALLLHAMLEAHGAWAAVRDGEPPALAFVREVFALPVVGRRADGVWACSYFDWDFGAARLRPADACVSVAQPIVTGLPLGDYHDATTGTFEVEGMRWRLTWPMPCRG